MKIGMLTGGGDCPGLNAVIRAAVRKGVQEFGHEFVGFRDGWRGPLEDDTVPLDVDAVRGILPRGGTILGSSRTNPFSVERGVERITETLDAHGCDALIAIGGEDTLGVATRLAELGVDVVGVPKTIDNDLSGTDFTFGFDTAVNVATEAIDRLHTTAESHHRVLVVEVMGRHAGWIALHSGLAGGANIILIPERPFDIERVCAQVESRLATRFAPIVVVSEGAMPARRPPPSTPQSSAQVGAPPACGGGAPEPGTAAEGAGSEGEGGMTLQTGEKDAFGHVRLGGIGERLAAEIEQRTGQESRAVVLGHVQRGGTPTAFDRWLATRFGLNAVQAVHDGDFGIMTALRGADIVRVPLAEATGELKVVDPALYEEAEVLFG